MGRVVGVWLAAVVWVFLGSAAHAAIVINEIMYNSSGSPDVEYVELINTGPQAQNVSGWTLLDDDNSHTPCPLSGTIPAGGFLVIAGKISLFNAFYPGAGPLNPTAFDSDTPGMGFGLGNATDQVRVFNAQGSLVDIVAYQSAGGWPTAADGGGPSLELRHPALDNTLPTSWAASIDPPPRGTPGQTNSVFVSDPAPVISDVERSVGLPKAADVVTITAKVTDQAAVTAVDLLVDLGSGFVAQPMFDDAQHGDGLPGDLVWGASIPAQPTGELVRYYVRATDTLPQNATAPATAPTAFFAYTVGHELPDLEITEFLAANANGIVDEEGEGDDWLEIKNRGPATVSLAGMFLSDVLTNSRMWEIPPVVLAPGQWYGVWCDLEPHQGPNHTNFTLSKEGGEVGLFDTVVGGNLLVHGMTYGVNSDDVSFGLLPEDADAPEYLIPPTPGVTNATAGPFSPVVINEFLAGSAIPSVPDWVELYNRSSITVDIGGWMISDGTDAAPPNVYVFPSPTPIAPGAFLSVDANQLGFGLSIDGSDSLSLTGPGALVGRDWFDFGPQNQDVSQGRFPNGSPNWHFFSPATRDLPNSCSLGGVPPAPVTGVRFPTRTAMTWSAHEEATAYDVLHGNLALLRSGAGFGAAVTGCLENNSDDTETWVGETPAPGNGRFYLVRGVDNACAFGTYDSGGAHQVAPRDTAIATAPNVCP